MALFTTELRTVCEQMCERPRHSTYVEIDATIADSWEKIFSSAWNTFDPNYKVVLCRKILKHYWMREIGCETVGLWLHYLNTRLEEIMPYYNQLYKSAAMEFDPLHDYDLTHTSKRTEDGNTDSTSSSNTSDTVEGTGTVESSSDGSDSVQTNQQSGSQSISKFSDTPQGSLSGVMDGEYLTNATVADSTDDQSGTRQGTHQETATSETSRTENKTSQNQTTGNVKATTTEDYVLTIRGKGAGKSYSKLLMEYRQTLINIDSEIIDKLSDLFMGLWA